MVDYKKVMDAILSRYVNNRLILGIDGLSRSGKTTKEISRHRYLEKSLAKS